MTNEEARKRAEEIVSSAIDNYPPIYYKSGFDWPTKHKIRADLIKGFTEALLAYGAEREEKGMKEGFMQNREETERYKTALIKISSGVGEAYEIADEVLKSKADV